MFSKIVDYLKGVFDWSEIFSKKDARDWWKRLALRIKELIQEANEKYLDNAEKRKWVAEQIDKKYDLPYVSGWLEGLVIRALIEVVFILTKPEETPRKKGL